MNYFTKEEILRFNEILLGRGVPNQQDGIGYNKADFSACSTYFYGLSDAQFADLAKRLVKYSKTQLNVDKDVMKATAEYLLSKSVGGDRSNGISVDIRGESTLISFRYNTNFVNVMNRQKRRKWDGLTKCWVVPSNDAKDVLNALESVGADVDSAVKYIDNNVSKTEVQVKLDLSNKIALLKFEYDSSLISLIKTIDFKHRRWNMTHKFWEIDLIQYKTIIDKIKSGYILKFV